MIKERKLTEKCIRIVLLIIIVISIVFIANINKISCDSTEDKMINDNRGVPVICYHSIGDDPSKKSPLIISPEKFRKHLQLLKDNGYATLSQEELRGYLFENKEIPEKSVVITFDDGYVDNYTNAFPILKEFNMKATMFIIASYTTRDDSLNTEQIKEMSDYGIDIESHTLDHKRLGELSYEEQEKEVKDSKGIIESITGKKVISIAYPEGIYDDDTRECINEAGYDMGFTIERGYADRDDDKGELNRICVDYTYGGHDLKKVLTKLKK